MSAGNFSDPLRNYTEAVAQLRVAACFWVTPEVYAALNRDGRLADYYVAVVDEGKAMIDTSRHTAKQSQPRATTRASTKGNDMNDEEKRSEIAALMKKIGATDDEKESVMKLFGLGDEDDGAPKKRDDKDEDKALALHIDRAMGLAQPLAGVRHGARSLELGVMTKEEAARRVAEIERGGR